VVLPHIQIYDGILEYCYKMLEKQVFVIAASTASYSMMPVVPAVLLSVLG
jgi:uncharacterized protein (UPF0332 family)